MPPGEHTTGCLRSNVMGVTDFAAVVRLTADGAPLCDWLRLPDGRHGYTNTLFVEMYQYHTAYLSGQITPEGEDFGIDVIAAMREAVGPSIGILLDAHG